MEEKSAMTQKQCFMETWPPQGFSPASWRRGSYLLHEDRQVGTQGWGSTSKASSGLVGMT